MYKVYGRVNGRGRRVYIKSVYADDVKRLVYQGNIMYVIHGTEYRNYTDLLYEAV